MQFAAESDRNLVDEVNASASLCLLRLSFTRGRPSRRRGGDRDAEREAPHPRDGQPRPRDGELLPARPHVARLRLRRRQRAAAERHRAAGALQEGLLGRPRQVEALQEHVPRVRRPEAGVVPRRLQGERRLVLGAADVAADAAERRLRAVDARAEGVGGTRLPLDGRDGATRRVRGLGLRRPLPRGLRSRHLSRQAGLRLTRRRSPAIRSTRTGA